jgi:hypothetical protein
VAIGVDVHRVEPEHLGIGDRLLRRRRRRRPGEERVEVDVLGIPARRRQRAILDPAVRGQRTGSRSRDLGGAGGLGRQAAGRPPGVADGASVAVPEGPWLATTAAVIPLPATSTASAIHIAPCDFLPAAMPTCPDTVVGCAPGCVPGCAIDWPIDDPIDCPGTGAACGWVPKLAGVTFQPAPLGTRIAPDDDPPDSGAHCSGGSCAVACCSAVLIACADQIAAIRALAQQHLDRDAAADLRLYALVHPAHTADPEQPRDAIRADRHAEQGVVPDGRKRRAIAGARPRRGLADATRWAHEHGV